MFLFAALRVYLRFNNSHLVRSVIRQLLLPDQGNVAGFFQGLSIGKLYIEGVSIHIHRLRFAIEVTIPTQPAAIALEYFLSPAVVNAPGHFANAESFYPYNAVLTEPARRKGIG